jgi:hypothetical protein
MCGGGSAPPEADIPTISGLRPNPGAQPQIQSGLSGRAQPFRTSGGTAANGEFFLLSTGSFELTSLPIGYFGNFEIS